MRINEPLFEILAESLTVGEHRFAKGDVIGESALGRDAQWLSDRRVIARIGFRDENVVAPEPWFGSGDEKPEAS